jgi:glutamyl-tRNA(Gln) amidotransferase subunit D
MDITKVPLYAKVRLTAGTSSFTGILLPREGEAVVLKLASGYNVGLSTSSIIGIELLAPPAEGKEATKQDAVPGRADLPSLLIVHTGGTIASRVDYKTGGVVADFSPEALLGLFPELGELVKVESVFLGNMWSDDFRFSHFNRIATAVHDATKRGISKVIVTSGTDFLHYLSAALSFQLKDVPAGVLVVGAQRSSDRGSSDAGMNLLCAAQFLTTVDFQGVATCLHASSSDDRCLVIPGTGVRKLHTSRRDAFKPVNSSPIALVDSLTRTVELKKSITAVHGEVPATVPLFKEDLKVGLFYSHPNMYADELLFYKEYAGMVLAGSGLGQFPVTRVDDSCAEHERIREAIALLASRMPVVMSSQAINGRVNMNVYSPARELTDLGVIGHLSLMTPETSFVKLAFLLSVYDAPEAARLFMDDLVGELSPADPEE